MTEGVKEALRLEKEMQNILGVSCDVEINGYTDFVFLNRFGGLQHQGTLNRVYKRIIRDCNDAAYSWAFGYYYNDGYLYGCDTGNER